MLKIGLWLALLGIINAQSLQTWRSSSARARDYSDSLLSNAPSNCPCTNPDHCKAITGPPTQKKEVRAAKCSEKCCCTTRAGK